MAYRDTPPRFVLRLLQRYRRRCLLRCLMLMLSRLRAAAACRYLCYVDDAATSAFCRHAAAGCCCFDAAAAHDAETQQHYKSDARTQYTTPLQITYHHAVHTVSPYARAIHDRRAPYVDADAGHCYATRRVLRPCRRLMPPLPPRLLMLMLERAIDGHMPDTLLTPCLMLPARRAK